LPASRHGLLRHVGAFPLADMSASAKRGHVPRTPTPSLLFSPISHFQTSLTRCQTPAHEERKPRAKPPLLSLPTETPTAQRNRNTETPLPHVPHSWDTRSVTPRRHKNPQNSPIHPNSSQKLTINPPPNPLLSLPQPSFIQSNNSFTTNNI
jgi:hypothetical protein